MSEKPNNQVPNYVKVQNYILEKCRSGEYAVGSRIPSETELARMFSVSRMTAFLIARNSFCFDSGGRCCFFPE